LPGLQYAWAAEHGTGTQNATLLKMGMKGVGHLKPLFGMEYMIFERYYKFKILRLIDPFFKGFVFYE